MPWLRHLSWTRLVFIGFFMANVLGAMMHDPDYFWHLRTGQYLAEHRSLPAGDIFSFTFAGQTWVLHEWLFELLLHGMHTLGGEWGVRLLVALLSTATLALVHVMVRQFVRSPVQALLITLACFVLLKLGASPRPHLLTYFGLSITLLALVRHKYQHDSRWLWGLPVLMVIWVNAHAGYVIGLALMGLWVGCEWLLLWLAGAGDAAVRQRLRLATALTGLTVLASVLNPDLHRHWLYPLQVMTMEASHSYISEWHSPDFHELPGRIYLALVFAFFIVTAWRQHSADLTEWLVPCVFAALGFVSSRHVPLATLVLAVFVARGLADPSPLSPAGQALLSRATGVYHRLRGPDLGQCEHMLNAIVLLAMLTGLVLYLPQQRERSQEALHHAMPVRAVDFMQAKGLHGRLFSAYHYGGYLIWRLYPHQKVFIDGRADVYGDDFLKTYLQIYSGQADALPAFDAHRIDLVLVPRDAALRQILLARGGFVQVFEADGHSLLTK